ncbi:Pyridoxamine 5'-phosphate oxidase [Rhizobiales bacterium GAS191]|nr:Pyridoxamine 5'-phosphate oxidase [Rhizobiales bacterium GAS191]
MIAARHDFDPDVVLSKPLMAHLATSSPDGPRESPVWFLWEQGAIWLIGTSRDSFPKRLRAEPRCAIGIVDYDRDRGLLRHVGIRGVAEIQDMDPSRLERLLHNYLGPDRSAWNAWFIEKVVTPLDLMMRNALEHRCQGRVVFQDRARTCEILGRPTGCFHMVRLNIPQASRLLPTHSGRSASRLLWRELKPLGNACLRRATG